MNSKPEGSKYWFPGASYYCHHCDLYLSTTDTKTHLKEVFPNLARPESSVSQVPSAKPASNSNAAISKPKSSKKKRVVSGLRKIAGFFSKIDSLKKGTMEAKYRESLPKQQAIVEIPLAVRNIDCDSEAEMARIIKETFIPFLFTLMIITLFPAYQQPSSGYN